MKTVLVVDDSELVLEAVKKSLETAGYRVVTRTKATGSVAAILRDRPDVVLLDVNMPTLASDTIPKILARVTQNPDTVVLLHSSLPLDTLRLKALASGAHGYIQKTESAVELVRRIEYWLNRGRPNANGNRLDPAPDAFGAPPDSSRSGSSQNRSAHQNGAPGSSSAIKVEPVTSTTAFSRTGPGPTSGGFRVAPAVGGSGPSSSRIAIGDSKVERGIRPKVLFVDDDWGMLNTYRTIITGHLEGEFVASANDAFNRILSDSPPSVIVCDVNMPGLSGADIYRRAVMLDPRWGRRFLFVTGAASTPAVAEFLNTLDVRVFHKPLAPERLLDTLKQMTESSRR